MILAKYRSPFVDKAVQTTPFKKKGSWRAGFHTGEDWVCDNRQLVCPANAVVSYNGYDANGYGYYIIIHTDDNRAILMGHFEKRSVLEKGDKVKAGDKVGIMGSTGNSTGPHLHIEVQSVADWNYGENLLKPSDYIDFEMFKGEIVMKKGEKSDGVLAYKMLLILLKEYGIISQGVDKNGVFGSGTEIATKQVQKAAKLKQSGVADADTVLACKKLIESAEKSSAKTISALNLKIANAKTALK